MRAAGFNPDTWPELMTITEASKAMDVHPNTIRKWIKDGTMLSGKLLASKILGVMKIPRGAVLEILDGCRAQTSVMSTMTLLQVNDSMHVIADAFGEEAAVIEDEFNALLDFRYLEIVPLTMTEMIEYMTEPEMPLEAHLRVTYQEPTSVMGRVLCAFLAGRAWRSCIHCQSPVLHLTNRVKEMWKKARKVEHAKPYGVCCERYLCRACDKETHVISQTEAV